MVGFWAKLEQNVFSDYLALWELFPDLSGGYQKKGELRGTLTNMIKMSQTPYFQYFHFYPDLQVTYQSFCR